MEINENKVLRYEKDAVLLQIAEDCNLWPYMLLCMRDTPSGRKLVEAYMFEPQNASAGDIVVVYSSKGINKSYLNNAKTKTHELYWGLDHSVWDNPNNLPFLVKIHDVLRIKE